MVDSKSKPKREIGANGSSMLFPSRVVIEHVTPELDGGKFPIKRVLGEPVRVTASVHTDGHNILTAVLLHRCNTESGWRAQEMRALGNGLDTFAAEFRPDKLGMFEYTVEAWIDTFANWRRDTIKKLAANQDVSVEITEGANLLAAAAQRADDEGKAEISRFLEQLRSGESLTPNSPVFSDTSLIDLMIDFGDRGRVCHYDRVLSVVVEPPYAQFSSWYELFPRSASAEPGRHGTLKDVIARLPYVAEMGFDVLYLPPIHPIGTTKRKGKNNTLTPSETDPGSPWAIGAAEGGHKSIHPELGTFADFDELVRAADSSGIKIALDIAFQCSPDHPYVKEHPEWFYHRPDGSIKYAENPPKRYEDIYPIDFECAQWQALWDELVDVVRFWVQKGVHVFRVDNPHTKPYPFWSYLIETIKNETPEVIFLSEAFARPRIMEQLAKAGFSQSYTYYTWRNSKWELMQYVTELTRTSLVEYFRPNFFANTPDILPENLQHGGRSSYIIRAALAATLSSIYGIYGPVYELAIADAIPGTEEYHNSEKYEIRQWDLNDPSSIQPYIARLNCIRKQHPALHNNRSLRFLDIENDNMIAYAKSADNHGDLIVVVISLDPYNPQSGFLSIPRAELGIESNYQLHDLITNKRFNWSHDSNLVQLTPNSPAYIFRVRRHTRREHDFDYFV